MLNISNNSFHYLTVKMFHYIVLLAFLICESCSGFDTDMETVQSDKSFFEGNALLGDQVMERNAVLKDKDLWPDGVIPYEMDPKLNLYERKIKRAMKHFEDRTCIRFKERTNERNYVRIFNGRPFRCYAEVGKKGQEQRMSLGYGCRRFGAILHELGHVVGLYHEHSRVDRDDYLIVNVNHVLKGEEYNFRKFEPNETRTIGPFDYKSIMLYSAFTASKFPGILKVLRPKQSGVILWTVAQKGKLSDWDVKKINILYKCDERSRKISSEYLR